MTPVIDHAQCVKIMKPYNSIDNGMMCAGFPNQMKGACSVSTYPILITCKHNLHAIYAKELWEKNVTYDDFIHN